MEKQISIRRPELLVPASSLEVLKTAVMFGADAVYIGGEAFSLRAKAKNFSPEEMKEGIEFAHAHHVAVHVTANILAHNYDLEQAAAYFRELKALGPDALIIADPGMVMLAKEHCPDIPIHISTQANNTNYMTYRFWYDQGIRRVVSARELSLREIRQIREQIPADMEIESFIHGAMCISYSGRCLLSNYFTGRDANRGACTHPCRWKYALMEESREGEYLPVFENERGTYIFNSKDLCMIEHIPEMIDAGIDSFKIEGRMKTALYVATVARTYRKAIDAALASGEAYEQILPWCRKQISQCTYRQFTTGFYFGKTDEHTQIYENNTYEREAVYLGIVEQALSLLQLSESEARDALLAKGAVDPDTCCAAAITQRNKFCVGDRIEIMKPDGRDVECEVIAFINEEGKLQESAPHAKQQLLVVLSQPVAVYDLLRKPAGT
ncbi:MAG: U32 family peptidase [Lachnospiraceae bacterium]|nr:U32 family peptidase [Lachnospiraceae bacterium]